MRGWRRIAMLAAIFLPLCAAAGRIVFLGDSLTAGYGLDPAQAYPALIEAQLREAGRPVTVVNAGVSGDTSAGGLRRIHWLLRQPIGTLVIALGANDALRGQSAPATRDNLRAIIRAARAARPDITVILAGLRAPPNMGEAYAAGFDALYPALAGEEGVLLIPFLLEGVAGDPALNLADGIHPNAEGQRRIARLVRPFVEQALDAQKP